MSGLGVAQAYLRALRSALCAPLLLAALLLAGGCGSSDQSATGRDTAARAQLIRSGARVFAASCQTCHALLGKPNTKVQVDALPLSLDEVKPSRAYVLSRLESGGVGMGAFSSGLSAADRRAVAEYVLAVAGRDVSAPPGGATGAQLAVGRTLYARDCQSCHKLLGRGPTHPNPIWTGTDFDLVRPGVLYVEQKVREGQVQAMPSFRDRLSWEQVRAVAVYVNAMALGRAGARGGR